MKLTEEQQAIFDAAPPDKQAEYSLLIAEADRIEAMPIEDKVDMLMKRVVELITAVRQHDQEFDSLSEIFKVMMAAAAASTQSPEPERPMPGQYL